MAKRNNLKTDWQFDEEPQNNREIEIVNIQLSRNQPRHYFDPDKLQQLTESVRTHGILEPLLVRPLQDGKQYELVAGERRYRAAQAVGLEKVPVTIRELSDEAALQLALVENLQREDLNPIEQAEGILQLLQIRLGSSTVEVPQLLYRMRNESIGNSNQNVLITSEAQTIMSVFKELSTISWESFVTTRLTLLNLPSEILDALRSGKIAYTKAQVIAGIKDFEQRKLLLEEAIAKDLSIIQIKERIKALKSQAESVPSLKSRMQEVYRRIQKEKIWDDRTKHKQLEQLISKLEALLSR